MPGRVEVVQDKVHEAVVRGGSRQSLRFSDETADRWNLEVWGRKEEIEAGVRLSVRSRWGRDDTALYVPGNDLDAGKQDMVISKSKKGLCLSVESGREKRIY